jgi:arylsulfatase A-like enzyme
VIVVSDHGFSTIAEATDIATDLSTAGFSASRVALGGLQDRQVLVQGNSGSTFFYVGGHDREEVRKIAAWAQTQPWAGVVFSKIPIEGTFALEDAKINSPEAPDLVVSMRWTLGLSKTGAPGLIFADGSAYGIGGGNHASLCPTEMHNTLVAAGPDFKPGIHDILPTGNIDVAPTVLWLLGFPDEALRRDGRVLGEALRVRAPTLKDYQTYRLTATRPTAGGHWEQYLLVSEVNGVRYLDEGNGAFIADKK